MPTAPCRSSGTEAPCHRLPLPLPAHKQAQRRGLRPANIGHVVVDRAIPGAPAQLVVLLKGAWRQQGLSQQDLALKAGGTSQARSRLCRGRADAAARSAAQRHRSQTPLWPASPLCFGTTPVASGHRSSTTTSPLRLPFPCAHRRQPGHRACRYRWSLSTCRPGQCRDNHYWQSTSSEIRPQPRLAATESARVARDPPRTGRSCAPIGPTLPSAGRCRRLRG